MAKATGFMEYTRQCAAHRPAAERVKDYNEFLVPCEGAALQTQAARCMDCGVPFCHAGMLVEGGSIGCPLNNLMPETHNLVYEGHWDEAYKRLAATHPFPEITGRVCPALCEGSCTLGEHGDPVTVRDIERSLADYGMDKGLAGHPCAPATGKHVAVVGSGPAGLAAADALSRLGNRVTVFDRADRPGGFLMYGIPNIKLDKDVLLARVELLKEQGVEFRLGCEVGRDLPVSSLVADFDAAVLCVGARSQRLLTAPGSDAAGVHTAVEYLSGATRALLDGREPEGFITAAGKDVIVVGGGDTGTDCVATAIRQGAKSVAAIEIMPPLPGRRAENNPWPLWPRVRKTDYGHEEAIELFGRDIREYETTVREVLSENGAVCAVETVGVRWEGGPGGRMTPVEIPGTEKRRPAQLVLSAMGFVGTEAELPAKLALELNGRGAVDAPEGDSTGRGGYRTALPGVFAAGDARRGPSLVVWAIYEGKRAGAQCHAWLQNGSQREA